MAACCERTVASSVAGVLLLALLGSSVFGVAGGLLLALLVNCLALMANCFGVDSELLGVVGGVLWMSELLLASR